MLPESLISIGVYAFDGCSGLERIWIDKNVTSIGTSAFGSCSVLTIHGIENTYAQTYAESNSIPFSTDPLVYSTVVISGQVIDQDGNGVSGVVVTLYDLTENETQEQVTTDENGSWSGDVIIGRDYQISFYHVDYTIAESIQDYTIGEEAVTVETVTAIARDTAVDSTVSDYSYTALNGTYCQITGYTGTATAIRIPAEINGYIVQSLANNVFKDNTTLTTVVFPETIETIGSNVFSGCTALTDVSFNNGLTNIGSNTFTNCTALEGITLPNTITSVGSYAFSGCTVLQGITLPNSVKSIGGYAFYNCTALSEVNLLEGLSTIYAYAFENCTSLTSIELPDSVTTLAARAFYNCTKLTEVGYPAGWTTVLDYYNSSTTYSDGNYRYTSPFEGCTGLKKITVDEGVASIPKHAFRYLTALEEVVLPESLISIGVYAFDGCTGLKTVNLEESLTTINGYAFSGCTGLKAITFPESLTSIGTYAFSGCTGLTSITLPCQMKSISGYTFAGCTGLTEMNLPEGLTTIYAYAFENCTSLTSIELPDSVTTLAARAFYNCTKLTEVGYPAGWTTVLDYYNSSTTYSDGNYRYTSPFEGCTGLKKITVDEGVASIPKHAFRYLTALEEVVLPESLISIGVYAFDGCTKLKTINLGEGLTVIPAYCFYNCTSLSELTLPENITSVGNYAFYNCIGFRLINMNENLKTIGSYAFYGCDGVLSLVLNDGLETINNNAFCNSVNLTAVEIPASVTTIGANVFDGCNKLTVYCYSGTTAHMVSESEGYTICLLDEHEHEFVNTIETAPTCTRGGSQIMTCTICNYNYIQLLEPLGHTQGEWVVQREPSCTLEGIRTLSCVVCEAELERVYTDALGHTEGEWILQRAATCTVAGLRIHKCSVCSGEIERVYIPAFGHTPGEWKTISGSCTQGGIRVKYCYVCNGEVQRETLPSTGHTWGDWIIESVPSVLCNGVKARTCSICREREEIITEKVSVDYKEDEQYGLAHFTIVDATTLEPISNANVFISTENDGEATLTVDANGKLSQTLPVGHIKLSVYASGYQTRNISLTIKPGENEIPTIGISSKNLVHGELTATEMTYEEMIEAGIDVTDPSNQHLYKYALVLEFVPEIDWLSIAYYWGGSGGAVVTGFSGPNNGGGGPGGGGAGGVGPGYCEVINDPSGVGRGVKYTTTTGGTISVYPVSERFFLIIYGEVHWVKEMYDVELLAVNTSQTDTVENLVGTLHLPEGLSLAKMVDGEQSLVQYMGSLDKGESKSVHWYVRGDEEGSYNLSATLKGSMLPFGDTFEYTYETQEPLKVYAGSAMHLTFYAPDSAFTGEEYTVRIELENVSDKTLYNVTHAITDVDQYRVTEYSDGMIEIEEYPVTGGTGSIFIPEFRPGDVIVIETTTTIMFESKLMDYKKQQAKNLLSQVQGLMQGFEALETGLGMMFSVDEWISTAVEAVQDYIDDAIITSSEKEQMAKSVIRQLEDLSKELSGDPTAGKTRKIQELKNAGVWDEVQAIINDPSVLDDYSGKKLAKLSAKLSAANAIQMEEFDIYESVAKIIELMPVRFRLVDAWVATLEESTTVIPSTIHVTPVGAHYFGVDSVSNYIASLFKLYVLDEIADEIPIDIIGDKYKEDAGYYEALDYVRVTENRASLYNVSGTGGSGFKAWIERADSSDPDVELEAPNFDLEIDNGTGVMDENGVLSFTGSGVLSVTPRSQVPGVLCIEMEDGTIAEYPMVVVEEHECSSEQWHIAIAPTDTTNGFQVKTCDICGEILDMGEIAPCTNHEFTAFAESQGPTLEAAGVNVRTCIHCGCAEYSYSDAYAMNGYIYRFEAGTTVEEITSFFNEKGMAVTMEDFEATDWAATGYTLDYEGEQYQIVIHGDTDGDAEVTIFDLLEVTDHVNGDTMLTGAGLEASLSDIYESEPSVFDLISISDAVNGGE